MVELFDQDGNAIHVDILLDKTSPWQPKGGRTWTVNVELVDMPEDYFGEFVLYKRRGNVHYFKKGESKFIVSLLGLKLPYGTIFNMKPYEPS
jgi:hypothetical protein